MELKPRASQLRALTRSALRPLHVFLLVISVLMALDPAARLIGLLGGLLWAVLLAYDALSPAPESRPETVPEAEGEAPAAARTDRYRDPIRAADAARRRIHDAVQGSGRSLARVMSPIRAQADQVYARLHSLVERAARIDRFLARENREELEASLALLEEQAAATTDDFTREQYLQARRAREEQLRDHDELALCLDRVRAQIANVVSSLEAAEAKVIKLQAADLRHAGDVTDAVTRSLQELSHEMSGFQESVDATIALRAR